jgi:hypothetical protein
LSKFYIQKRVRGEFFFCNQLPFVFHVWSDLYAGLVSGHVRLSPKHNSAFLSFQRRRC